MEPYFDEMYKLDLEKSNKITFMTINWKNSLFSKSQYNILISWLFECYKLLKISKESLYLAINYLDRFLCINNTSLKFFQLVGISCLFLADKYENNNNIDPSTFSYLTDGACNRNDILVTEKLILNSLDYDLNVTTIPFFLNIYLCILKLPSDVVYHTKYVCDLLLLNHNVRTKYTSNVIAISIVFISHNTYLDDPLSMDKIGVNAVDIEPCVNKIKKYLKRINSNFYKDAILPIVKQYNISISV